MRGPDLGGKAVDWQSAVLRLQPFLQRGLVILGEPRVRAGRVRLLDEPFELPLDERPRRLDAAVEIDRGDKRLVAIGDQRELLPSAGFLFAAAQNQVVAEPQLVSQPAERGGRHERRFQLRLLAFVVLRELAKEQVGDHEPQHRVAEEFERLVVDDATAGVFVNARAMRQRVFE